MNMNKLFRKKIIMIPTIVVLLSISFSFSFFYIENIEKEKVTLFTCKDFITKKVTNKDSLVFDTLNKISILKSKEASVGNWKGSISFEKEHGEKVNAKFSCLVSLADISNNRAQIKQIEFY